MKEKLYTIPLNDAVNAGDECPFCYIERNVEQDLMDFVLGSCASYMESDVREDTDREGFCRTHMKKMFDYGNTLGNGWILKTYYKKLLSEMDGEFRHFRPQKQSMGDKLRKIAPKNSVADWVQKKESTCYICDRFQKNTSAIWTLFSIYMKKTRISKHGLQRVRAFACIILGSFAAARIPDCRRRKKRPFSRKFSRSCRKIWSV